MHFKLLFDVGAFCQFRSVCLVLLQFDKELGVRKGIFSGGFETRRYLLMDSGSR